MHIYLTLHDTKAHNKAVLKLMFDQFMPSIINICTIMVILTISKARSV